MFFLAEGFRYTHSRRKYGLRLLIFALVTQIAYCILNDKRLPDALLQWNVIMTLFSGFLCLCVLDSKQKCR